MSKIETGKGVVAAVTAAFLERRLHHQRMRMAALRALKSVQAGQGDRLQLDFDAGSGHPRARSPLAGERSGMHVVPSDDARPNPYLAPRLNLVIMIVGSRGDVQPFIPIGQAIAAWRSPGTDCDARRVPTAGRGACGSRILSARRRSHAS